LKDSATFLRSCVCAQLSASRRSRAGSMVRRTKKAMGAAHQLQFNIVIGVSCVRPACCCIAGEAAKTPQIDRHRPGRLPSCTDCPFVLQASRFWAAGSDSEEEEEEEVTSTEEESESGSSSKSGSESDSDSDDDSDSDSDSDSSDDSDAPRKEQPGTQEHHASSNTAATATFAVVACIRRLVAVMFLELLWI